ncbi:MAG: HPr(Ser) kinase/phosphatase [Ruminococcaceae bacterium]|nr:HPr(Ser) kinase/phosphatase [Oscillospiraceae bacterium]
MADIYSVELSKIISEFSLDEIYMPDDPEKILIHASDVNRPGLQLAGFFDHFEPQRIQIIGKVEYKYLESLAPEKRREAILGFFEQKPVAVVITHQQTPFEEITELGEYFEVPVLSTEQKTSEFMAALIAWLNVQLAPRITRHGVLVEVYGEGILILGDSGVGKSETAIELVKRGHRLIADDAVEIKRVSAKALVGSAPEIIRHYVELRGIGIVDVRRIFGMGAVKLTEKIDLIINLEPWVQGKMYDRFGLDTEVTDILGIKVPTITIPVKPGRNLAIILEIAAMNNRQKKMGYNTAVEFNKRLMGQMGLDGGDTD